MTMPLSPEDIDRIIAERLSGIVQQYEEKLAEAEQRIAEAVNANRAIPPTNFIPFNAGGPGTAIHGTWSQHHQDLANRGELTDEHIQATR